MEIVGKVPNFTAEETKSAIDHADKAFQSWKKYYSERKINNFKKME